MRNPPKKPEKKVAPLKGKYERWDVEATIAMTKEKHGRILQEGHTHTCPYCGFLNKKHRVRAKGRYTKCEKCGCARISRNVFSR